MIAQEWEFTYRYPSYGGIETPHLVLPDNELVELHVTSLDVIHSFWATSSASRPTPTPAVTTSPTSSRPRSAVRIRCSELCGIWHGYMFDTGRVVTAAAFATWIQSSRRVRADHEDLPPYSRTYVPTPDRRGT